MAQQITGESYNTGERNRIETSSSNQDSLTVLITNQAAGNVYNTGAVSLDREGVKALMAQMQAFLDN